MRYYKVIKEDKLIAIGEGYGGIEITLEEYESLLSEIKSKVDYVNKLYNGSITIDEVPLEWQEEIQERVNERIALDEAKKELEETIEV